MTATRAGDLDDILAAVREVEASLASRENRAGGAVMMIWGSMVTSIFVFYQLVTWNPAPYAAAVGPLLPWLWLVPATLGFALSAAVGARMGRVAKDPHAKAAFRHGVVVGGVASVLATGLTLLGAYERIPGGTLVVLGIALLLFALPMTARYRAACGAAGVVSLVAGGAFLLYPVSWSCLGAAAIYAACLFGLGAWRYRAAW